MSFSAGSFGQYNRDWINTWTIFYWAWWISWSPFVGVFIARISKGRSIRQFLSIVLLAPTVLSFLWFSTFGTLSTHVQSLGNVDLTQFPSEQTLFATFSQLPFGFIASVVAIILIITFFITSADSATYVLLSGGLVALQNTLIIVAFPFSLIMVLIMVSLVIELLHEKDKMGLSITPTRYPKKDQPFKSYEE